jgi:acetyl esterase/lipase
MKALLPSTTLRDLYQISCFKEAGPLLFPILDQKNLSLEQSIESAAKQSLFWLPPNAIEGLNFTAEHGRYYGYPLGGSGCFVYPRPGAKRVLFVLPGGGYGSLSTLAEGLPFAQQAFLAGDAVVVVGYRYGKEAANPNVLDDLAMAVTWVYQKHILGDEVLPYTLLGFSAGGHLAGVFASEAEGYSRYHLPSPSALALAYPVVSLLPPTHQDTAMNFLGDHYGNLGWEKRFSLSALLTPSYPPIYLWHCAEDPAVPSISLNRFVEAVRSQGIDLHYRVYPGKGHGWALGEGTPAEGWFAEMLQWEKEKNNGDYLR